MQGASPESGFMFACPCGEEREGEEGREGHCHRAKGKGEAEALAEVFHSFPAKECNLSKAIETDGTQRRAERSEKPNKTLAGMPLFIPRERN